MIRFVALATILCVAIVWGDINTVHGSGGGNNDTYAPFDENYSIVHTSDCGYNNSHAPTIWGNINTVHASSRGYSIYHAPDDYISLRINITYTDETNITTYLSFAYCDYIFCNNTMCGNYTRNKTIQAGNYSTTLKAFFNCDIPNATYLLLVAHAPIANASTFSALYVISPVLWINITFKYTPVTNYSGSYNNTTLAFVDLMQYFYPLVNVGIFLAIAFFIIIGFRKILAPLLE